MPTPSVQTDRGQVPLPRTDVLIIGAGISGIDAAWHLQQYCPQMSYQIIERQDNFGGTWRTHSFPGIRSDSDLFTFGFHWKPWTGTPIASAGEILKYLGEAIDEQHLESRIHYSQHVTGAHWETANKCWRVECTNLEDGTHRTLHCNFLWMCQGYFDHQQPYQPEFPGMDRFDGAIVHPQHWPSELDHRDRNVVVIGSGATAATLIPALAKDSRHVTMLQRSPTYYFARPNSNELADVLAPLELPDEWFHEIMRRKMLHEQREITRRSFEEPESLRRDLLAAAQQYLGDEYPLEPHFTPSYRPWQQRLAIVPDGDLFKAIRAGAASVVTDHIECFNEHGILLKSGQQLNADIIVTATGLQLCPLGNIPFTIDNKALNFGECTGRHGIMFTGVPNLAWVFGYLRTSWTMRATLVSQFVCRLLQHMEQRRYAIATPQLRESDRDMTILPFVEDDNFNAGYLKRGMHLMPKQGDREPWVFSFFYQPHHQCN